MGITYKIEFDNSSSQHTNNRYSNLNKALNINIAIKDMLIKQYTHKLQNSWLAKLYKKCNIYTKNDIDLHAIVNLSEVHLHYTHMNFLIGDINYKTSMYVINEKIDIITNIISACEYTKSIELDSYEYSIYIESINTKNTFNELYNENVYSRKNIDMTEKLCSIHPAHTCCNLPYRGYIYNIIHYCNGNVNDERLDEINHLIKNSALIDVASHCAENKFDYKSVSESLIKLGYEPYNIKAYSDSHIFVNVEVLNKYKNKGE